MNMSHEVGTKDEKAFFFPYRRLRFFCDGPLHRLRLQVKCRNDAFRYDFHFHLSRSLDQDPVILFQEGLERDEDLFGLIEKGDPLLGKSLFHCPRRRGSREGALEKNPIYGGLYEYRSYLLMQWMSLRSKFQHIGQDRYGPALLP